MTVLRVNDLCVRRESRTIVRQVSFTARRGERIVVMGESGAGKTSVLRAIAGLDPIAGGTIVIEAAASRGATASSGALERPGQRVGMVFQFHHLFEHMTALQNVWLAPVHAGGESRTAAEARALELLDRLGVAHRAQAMPHELSGGEAQRVAIARALAVNPRVLLMDEPTASLDAARRAELATSLHALSSDGTTLIVATHDAEFARAFAHRILVLEGGRITRDGAPSDVLA